MKVANMQTKRKKDYTQELYFDVIEEIKKQFGDYIFKEKPNLFAQVAELMGGDTAEKKAKRRRETSIANLNKRKDVKPLPVWTGRRVTIQKPESQAIKNCILELGRKVERFTRAEAKEACKGVISDVDSVDSVLHSQIIYMLNHGLIKTVAKGLKETLKNGKKKINYYALC
jgi:hypothetical protein